MFWNLLATVICGLGAAGFALGIRAITAKRAPKWLIPVFAGLGMLGYLVYSEYTWFEHKKSLLPEEAVVVSTEEEGVYFRPWTFIFPYVTAFSAVDVNGINPVPNSEGVKQFVLYRFEQTFTDSVSHRPHLLNCQTRELVPLSPDGKPNVDSLKVISTGDSLYKTVCGS
ncbi:hypothetical protein [Marinobacter persicus]|uniref:Uncharacterized protein n=1 Tax=Marinobacter persicus TaxID=930118 RepID=A0A2S6G219_9GAMM|nr:hypothetical protein [Marinobacter persicus]PPK51202.1 hypothetical protein B0H24_10505 [Marinobacter persicus]PPK51570.1 hypothetical protein BY455_11186 [Marinobacter persicus]PPK58275.1 hypothetical protein BY454_11186 [Marinobacter persicus]